MFSLGEKLFFVFVGGVLIWLGCTMIYDLIFGPWWQQACAVIFIFSALALYES